MLFEEVALEEDLPNNHIMTGLSPEEAPEKNKHLEGMPPKEALTYKHITIIPPPEEAQTKNKLPEEAPLLEEAPSEEVLTNSHIFNYSPPEENQNKKKLLEDMPLDEANFIYSSTIDVSPLEEVPPEEVPSKPSEETSGRVSEENSLKITASKANTKSITGFIYNNVFGNRPSKEALLEEASQVSQEKNPEICKPEYHQITKCEEDLSTTTTTTAESEEEGECVDDRDLDDFESHGNQPHGNDGGESDEESLETNLMNALDPAAVTLSLSFNSQAMSKTHDSPQRHNTAVGGALGNVQKALSFNSKAMSETHDSPRRHNTAVGGAMGDVKKAYPKKAYPIIRELDEDLLYEDDESTVSRQSLLSDHDYWSDTDSDGKTDRDSYFSDGDSDIESMFSGSSIRSHGTFSSGSVSCSTMGESIGQSKCSRSKGGRREVPRTEKPPGFICSIFERMSSCISEI